MLHIRMSTISSERKSKRSTFSLPAIGTAFVIGLLEIVAGELETGVTRFVAVSVKTFVLTMGSCVGLQVALNTNIYDAWTGQYSGQCGAIDLNQQWWRIPLYLLCSASALGQYRFPIGSYWRGLIVQLAGYEVKYQMFQYLGPRHPHDFLDTGIYNIYLSVYWFFVCFTRGCCGSHVSIVLLLLLLSASPNICGAMAAVVAARLLSYFVDTVAYYYNARVLQRNKHMELSTFGKCMYSIAAGYVRLINFLGLGRQSSLRILKMRNKLEQQAEELRDPSHPRTEITLLPQEESALVEAIVGAEDINVWSLLMPAVYQLVPGSLIAKLWYNVIFPPLLEKKPYNFTINGEGYTFTDRFARTKADEVTYGLWVVSASLALGLLLGFTLVQVVEFVVTSALAPFVSLCSPSRVAQKEAEQEEDERERRRSRQQGVMHIETVDSDDNSQAGADDSPIVGGDKVVIPLASDANADENGKETSVRFQPLRTGTFLQPLVEGHGVEVGETSQSSKPTIVKMQMDENEKADLVSSYTDDYKV